MNPHLVVAFVGFVLPFAAATYGSAAAYDGAHGVAYGDAGGVEDFLSDHHQHGAASITSAADVGVGPSAQAGLAQANAQLQALNANPNYHNLQNSDTIAESLAENSLGANIRPGNINVVAPNVAGQTAFGSLLVPNGLNNYVVTATQPLQPIVVNQPGAPPAQISSGPPAVVRAAPVVYKLKPSVIYQQEVVNKVPTPLSLNPVYVKVYKPGKHVETPVAPPSYASSSYGSSSHSAGLSASVTNDGAYGASHYGSPPQYAAAVPSSYGTQPAY